MKPIIYQILVRLFGNQQHEQIFNGTLQQNGVGKLNDISDVALEQIKQLGISHVWYTGVINHATTTDYSVIGSPADHPQVVKGLAGSPYAIKDYYDIAPDLAVNVHQRMTEFEQLLDRTHRAGLKVVIDFVPNHVARAYHSIVKAKEVKDLGEDDLITADFDPNNNFYYLTKQDLHLPNASGPLSSYHEHPAKASGNDVFSAYPQINDWWETVKLNYGIDYRDGSTHFDPIPDTWTKMLDILLYWSAKGVDAFRCDMCEMVPTAFWRYVKTELAKQYPTVQLIGEAYSPSNYHAYISAGFDFLYDKVGLYDTVRNIVTGKASFEQMPDYLYSEIRGIEQHLLAFMENHDEQRICSPQFLGADGVRKSLAVMTLSACLDRGGVMIYNGQELGATAAGATGYSGDDGRTSLFDYTAIPEQQAWMNGGRFDGALLSSAQLFAQKAYRQLLTTASSEMALVKGQNYHLNHHNRHSEGFNPYLNYAFVRYFDKEIILIVLTVDEMEMKASIRFPEDLMSFCKIDARATYHLIDLLDTTYQQTIDGHHLRTGVRLSVNAWGVRLLKIYTPT